MTRTVVRAPTARALIRKLELSPHPEGGYFREIYRSKESVETARGRRAALTSIYYLLLSNQKSLLHRVASDEVWHYYAGAPLRLVSVTPSLKHVTEHRLGHTSGGAAQVVIPRLHWQAAESRGDYTLVGCTVGPGFDFSDFTMLKDDTRALARFRTQHPKLARFFGEPAAS